MERCDSHDHGGGGRECGKVRQSSGMCDSSQGGMKVVRNWFQLMERYDGCGGDVSKGVWEGVTVVRNCDSHQ